MSKSSIPFIGKAVEKAAKQEVEVIDENAPARTLGDEIPNNSIKAKVTRALGVLGTMEKGSWSGLDQWTCTKCGFSTFNESDADNHRC